MNVAHERVVCHQSTLSFFAIDDWFDFRDFGLSLCSFSSFTRLHPSSQSMKSQSLDANFFHQFHS